MENNQNENPFFSGEKLPHSTEKNTPEGYGDSHMNEEQSNPEDLYPHPPKCDTTNMVDESFRIDDNSNYSTTAMIENRCIDAPMVPGVGIEKPDLKDKENDKDKK